MGSNSSSCTVFILEDNESMADLMDEWTRTIFGENTTIHISNTLSCGISTVGELQRLDLAILDRNLPDGTGDDLVQLVAGELDAITLMVTGTSPKTEIIKLPIDDYLVKPIDEETFMKQVSLLDKLSTAGALTPYSNARKASLLEYHLNDPDESSLFRQFAARWSYDYLEIAHFDGRPFVYELYANTPRAEESSGEGHASVSVIGSLAGDFEEFLEAGKIACAGELLSTGDGYAWVETEGSSSNQTLDGSIGIYRFTCETPEQYITEVETGADKSTIIELEGILEDGFN